MIFFLIFPAGPAQAIPSLQLDIDGGVYSSAITGHTPETIVAPGDNFTLYAYLLPDRKALLSATYTLSLAILPRQTQNGNGADFGNFSFDVIDHNEIIDHGTNTPATASTLGLKYGVPSDLSGSGLTLQTHGIFPTYYYEYSFQFDSANKIAPYDTADRALSGDPISLISTTNKGMYYVEFHFDISNMPTQYLLHFDLYDFAKDKKGKPYINFAPFSHDAEDDVERTVPEPTTILLLGFGLIGVIFVVRRRSKKS